MTVRLIAKSVPNIPGIHGPDALVAYCARVSNPANQANTETAPRLLRYLREHQHWSPFEMASATLEIVTTRDIARQILRHRSFSFQEFSQRYSSEIDFAEPREARLQDEKNRQNSIEIEDDSQYMVVMEWERRQQRMADQAAADYKWAMAVGLAKEVARAVLPEGLTVSRLYMAGTLRSWLHYIDLRSANGTQKEHRLIAEDCRRVLAEHFPSVFA